MVVISLGVKNKFLKDTYSCIFNIIRLGTRHKKTHWMSETQFSCRGSNKELLVYR